MTRDCHLRSRHRLENPAGGERRSRAEPARGERPSRHRGDRAGTREGAFVSRKATRLYHLKTTGRRRTSEDEGERVLSERWEFSESEMELSPFNEKSRICPSRAPGQRGLCFGRIHHSAGNHAAFRPAAVHGFPRDQPILVLAALAGSGPPGPVVREMSQQT